MLYMVIHKNEAVFGISACGKIKTLLGEDGSYAVAKKLKGCTATTPKTWNESGWLDAMTQSVVPGPTFVSKRIQESNPDKHRVYFIMKRLPGHTLDSQLSNIQQQSSEQKLRIALSLSEALRPLHEANGVHNDLHNKKNILIDLQNNHSHVIDFGSTEKKDKCNFYCCAPEFFSEIELNGFFNKISSSFENEITENGQFTKKFLRQVLDYLKEPLPKNAQNRVGLVLKQYCFNVIDDETLCSLLNGLACRIKHKVGKETSAQCSNDIFFLGLHFFAINSGNDSTCALSAG